MVKFTWHEAHVPVDLPIRQIYGVLFTPDGRILLRIEKGICQLTGGKPEPWEPLKETLSREALEETNCRIDKIHTVGYQKVDDGEKVYAQLRFAALIREIGPAEPDPDRPGWTYGRILVSPERAIKLLPYGDISEPLIQAAIKIAKKYDFYHQENLPDEVLNDEILED